MPDAIASDEKQIAGELFSSIIVFASDDMQFTGDLETHLFIR